MKKPVRLLAFLSLLAAAPPVAAEAPAGTVPLDRAYLVGNWTDDNDCSNAIRFTAEGRFIAANGGVGEWALEGDRLTMSGNGTITVRLVPIDRDTLQVVNPDGSLGRSTRCPSTKAGEAPARSDSL